MYSVVNGLLVSRNIGMSKRTGCHSHGPERNFGYIPLIGCVSKPFKSRSLGKAEVSLLSRHVRIGIGGGR